MNKIQKKPALSLAQIWNMSVGFLGIQAGFGLQNGNASAILQRYGADVHELPNFWLVAPIIGMIVQPIIGYYSDNILAKPAYRNILWIHMVKHLFRHFAKNFLF